MDASPNLNPLEARYDDAMYDFTTEQFDSAIAKLEAILAEAPDYFDARLSLGMAWYRKGDFPRAIAEGHKAEKLRPNEQLVHTNLSLFYMKSGDKKTAEHHGLQARIASWRGNMDKPAAAGSTSSDGVDDSELKMAGVPTPSGPATPAKVPAKFPEMPWKKKPVVPQGPADTNTGQAAGAAVNPDSATPSHPRS
ncbi:MAG: tetratricopeptide repeat protein [Limisphaerales bacterium]